MKIYGCVGCALLVRVGKLGSKVDFVVESGMHVLTSRTNDCSIFFLLLFT